MAEYISREALRKAMYHEAFETDSDMQKWDSGCWIRYKMFENVIEDIPAAEVVEAKDGVWVLTDFPDGQTYKCSECGAYWVFIDGTPKDNGAFYCPNCGAKMDGGADNG